MANLIGQSIHQIISGNPDANNSDHLRGDAALQAAVGREEVLAGQPTMSRLDNGVSDKDLIRMAYALGDDFLDSFEEPPAMIIDMEPDRRLDFYCQISFVFFTVH